MQISQGCVAFIFVVASFLVGPYARAEESIELVTFKSHSRLILKVDDITPVEWKNTQSGFEILIKGLGLGDLGAPLGEEDQWKAKFEALADARIGSIHFEETLDGVKILGKWKFPQGKLALADPAMESFDYRNKSTMKYIVDVWVKDGPTLEQARANDRRNRFLALMKKTQEDAEKRINRKIASQKRAAEVENPNRFCEKTLSEDKDIFLDFNPVHQKVDFYRWFPKITPDIDFVYLKPKKKGREPEFVRLALDLYAAGKLGLTLRTLDFFESEFSRSEYQPELTFLRANTLIKLGLQNDGERLLNSLMIDSRGSQVAMKAATYLVGRLVEGKSSLAALDKFLWLIEYYGDDKLAWVFHLGAAECLFKLKQTERAQKEYRWVMEFAPTDPDKAEGSYRLGDLFLMRSQFEQALASYSSGFNYFKSMAGKFPSSLINQAESLYQLGQYERAHSAFESFLQDNPNHPDGWRATFRLAEIDGRESADQSATSSSRQWFYRTINRYPTSPGVTLARLRLLPCGDHGGFTLESQARFFAEDAEKYDGGDEVSLKNYRDLMALTQTRTLITLGTPQQAADSSLKELKLVKNPMVKKELTSIANHFFQKIIESLLNEGKKYDALAYYQSKRAAVPRPDEGADLDYLIKLSQSAADLGLGSFAEEIANVYLEYSNPTKAAGPNRAIAEDSLTDLESKMKVSEKEFTTAKALWIAGKKPKEVRALLGRVLEESKFSYEKELILGLMDEKDGKFTSALVHAEKCELMNPDPTVQSWIAQLTEKSGDLNVALDLYRGLEKRSKKAEKSPHSQEIAQYLSPIPSPDQLILAEGRILEKKARWGEAAATYSRGIDNGWGGNQIAFEYARTLIKAGDQASKKKARQTLEKLVQKESKTDSDRFWKNLAQEALEDEKSKKSVIQNAKEGIK